MNAAKWSIKNIDAGKTAKVFRGPGRIRTCDARFRKPTLYPLSYGAMGCVQNLVHNLVHNPGGLAAFDSAQFFFVKRGLIL